MSLIYSTFLVVAATWLSVAVGVGGLWFANRTLDGYLECGVTINRDDDDLRWHTRALIVLGCVFTALILALAAAVSFVPN